jgi:hypothetical protein
VDPSVLDLMNTVVREVPENAVDIIVGAASVDQIEHVWSFSKSKEGGPVASALAQHVNRLARSVAQRMLDGRRIDLGNGAVAYRGATFERRLTIVIDMADRLPDRAFSDLVEPLFDRMLEEWLSESLEINDAADVLRALDRTRSLPADEVTKRKEAVRSALLAEARGGCRSDELREIISVLSSSGKADDSVIAAIRTAFEEYRKLYFSDELQACRSHGQFDGLIEDLDLFKDELGVEVATLLERVEEAKAEFEEHEDAYADHMQDEWKERWRDERDNERSVSDMFGSLKGDRD